MLFKRGSTISAAEGGCQAEVGGVFRFNIITYHRLSIIIQSHVQWPALDLLHVWEVSRVLWIESAFFDSCVRSGSGDGFAGELIQYVLRTWFMTLSLGGRNWHWYVSTYPLAEHELIIL